MAADHGKQLNVRATGTLAARVRRELQGSTDAAAINFRLCAFSINFIASIMVDHLPLFEFVITD